MTPSSVTSIVAPVPLCTAQHGPAPTSHIVLLSGPMSQCPQSGLGWGHWRSYRVFRYFYVLFWGESMAENKLAIRAHTTHWRACISPAEAPVAGGTFKWYDHDMGNKQQNTDIYYSITSLRHARILKGNMYFIEHFTYWPSWSQCSHIPFMGFTDRTRPELHWTHSHSCTGHKTITLTSLVAGPD